MKKVLVLLASILILCSHGLFLKTNAYYLGTYEESEIFPFSFTHNERDNTLNKDRIIHAEIVGNDYDFIPDEKDWYDHDDATYLKFETGASGTYVAGISTSERIIEMSGADFNDYLEHDGVIDILESRKEKNLQDEPVKEKYAKHVKAIIQVSYEKSKHYKKVFGYPVEFVPESNPYLAKQGDEITFTLLKNSKPFANHLVYFGKSIKAEHGHGHFHDDKEGAVITDTNGKVTIKVDHKGKWYLRTIDMVESNLDNVDYISNWGTLKFEIR
ncbi:DUF4198 domain-containing protein [Chondrinema litorale]|uniref:DUF4198 domain-containing protein n=1 Tax=Chondrinema litorale TaxID=2994555 RepID=UPI002543A1E6|nr:DUF4198 domain-containing protein [Chondrinema litorale]UZR97262.1 DUF4198 domain-containing protein [Chondrinema litorale]